MQIGYKNFFPEFKQSVTFKNVIGFEGSTSDTIVLLQQVRNWSFCFVKWARLFFNVVEQMEPQTEYLCPGCVYQRRPEI